MSRRRMAFLFLQSGAVLAVCALFALLVYRLVHGRTGVAQAVRAHRAPQAPDVRLDVIWPKSQTWPPSLRTSIDHGTLTLRKLRGYPVVINFWASWCSPCRREAALLASAAQARSGRIVFVGVDVNDSTGDARRFLRMHDIPYVAVRSGTSVADEFGLIGLPETFYVDRGGRVRDVTQGELTAATLVHDLDRAARD
jgi:cytochrome c biogenesis protein CcmG, thiol:disulfide interchange protein DsbE